MGFQLVALLLSLASFQGGTQPGELQRNLGGSESCKQCHYNAEGTGQNNVYRGSMMDLASVDPFFLAALEIANADNAMGAELCVRCHFLGGWLQGQGMPTDGSGIATNQKVGISCDLCHRVKTPEPLSDRRDGGTLGGIADAGLDAGLFDGGLNEIVPDFSGVLASNAQLFIEDSAFKRGPFASAQENGHGSIQDALFKDSLFCAQCHEVTNPLLTWKNAAGEVLGQGFPAERTYSEWKNSAFAQLGADFKSCQDCHMQASEQLGLAATVGEQPRQLHSHELVGGNTLAPKMVAFLQTGPQVPSFLQNLSADAERISLAAEKQLQEKSASLTFLRSDVNTGEMTVRIENKTGHKLPTGYAEGRRIWVGHEVKAAGGEITAKSGTPDAQTFDFVEEPSALYEIKLGDENGTSFHFIQVDRILKDTRLPPRGFREDPETAVIGKDFGRDEDGATLHYDDVTLSLGDIKCFPAVVQVKLYYQTASGEYFRFLRDNAPIQGPALAEAWNAVGGGAPVVMQELKMTLFADGRVQEGGGIYECMPSDDEDAGILLDAGVSKDAGAVDGGGFVESDVVEPEDMQNERDELCSCTQVSAGVSKEEFGLFLALFLGVRRLHRRRENRCRWLS